MEKTNNQTGRTIIFYFFTHRDGVLILIFATEMRDHSTIDL